MIYWENQIENCLGTGCVTIVLAEHSDYEGLLDFSLARNVLILDYASHLMPGHQFNNKIICSVRAWVYVEMQQGLVDKLQCHPGIIVICG